MKNFFLLLLIAATPTIVRSQAGSLDSTFSGDGIVTQSFSGGSSARAIIVKPDGKIVVAGIAGEASLVMQYNEDGTIDNSFSGNGIFTIDLGGNYDEFNSLAIDSDGKIIVVGTTVAQSNASNDDIVVIRLLPNGKPDSTFSDDGILIIGQYNVDEEARSVAIQSDGKIVIGGDIVASPDQYFLAIRINEDGSIDSGFGANGFAKIPRPNIVAVNDMAILTDGKIILGGYVGQQNDNISFALLRLNSNGSVDSSFGIDGLSIKNSGKKDYAESLAVQNDGKIVLGGYSFDGETFASDFLLMRFKSDGSPDLSFATNGILFFSFYGEDDRCWSIALQPDGKILAGGWTEKFFDTYLALVRFNSDGSLDPSFGEDGQSAMLVFATSNTGHALCLQSDNKILQAGDGYSSGPQQLLIARYLNDVNTGVCEMPVGTAASNITSSSARLSWDESTGAFGYKIRYKVAGTDTWTHTFSSDNIKTLKDLLPATEYAWQVKSMCDVQPIISSEWSEKKFFTTDPLKLFQDETSVFEIYPNPATAFIKVTCADQLGESETVDHGTLLIINSLRQIVFTQQVISLQTTINISSWVPGIYLVQFNTPSRIEKSKFIKE